MSVQIDSISRDVHGNVIVKGSSPPGSQIQLKSIKKKNNTTGGWDPVPVLPVVMVDLAGNWEINLGNLPAGDYRIEIEIPGGKFESQEFTLS